MSISAFGVDHGEISKMSGANGYKRVQRAMQQNGFTDQRAAEWFKNRNRIKTLGRSHQVTGKVGRDVQEALLAQRGRPNPVSKALRDDDTKSSVMSRNMPLTLGGAALGGGVGYLGAVALKKPKLATWTGAAGAGLGVAPGSIKHANEQRALRRRNQALPAPAMPITKADAPTGKRRDPGTHALVGAIGGGIIGNAIGGGATAKQRAAVQTLLEADIEAARKGKANQAISPSLLTNARKAGRLMGTTAGATAVGAGVGGLVLHQRAKRKNRLAGWNF